MGTAYCLDEVYDFLDQTVSSSEYPYMLIVITNSNATDQFLLKPRQHLTAEYPNNSNEFTLFTINNKVTGKPVDLYKCDNDVLSPLDSKMFKRFNDITDTFKVPLSEVSIGQSSWIMYKDFVKRFNNNDNNFGMYKPSMPISKFHELRVHKYSTLVSQEHNSLSDDMSNHYLVFDHAEKFSYMFDKTLNKRLQKSQHTDEVVVSKILTKTPVKDNITSEDTSTVNRFFAHCLLFKKEATARTYLKYFEKHHDYDITLAMSSHAENTINQRYRKINSLREFFEIRVGETENKRKLYQVIFDWGRVEDNDLRGAIISEIKEGTFHTDKTISLKENSKLDDVAIFINEERFINKIKLMSKWKDCIDEIVVNDSL